MAQEITLIEKDNGTFMVIMFLCNKWAKGIITHDIIKAHERMKTWQRIYMQPSNFNLN